MTKKRALTTLTKQERVYARLRERILDGSNGPGYRLVIDSLAVEFNVSALPVREAIRRLEAEGLVTYRPNAGATVAPIDPVVLEEEMTLLAVLEGFATASAAPDITGEDLNRMTALNDEMVTTVEALDALGFRRLNQEFHGVVYDRCPNPSLVTVVRELDDRLALHRRTVFVYIPFRGKDAIREHEELIALLRQHAPAEAIEAAARAHKLNNVTSFRAWKAANDDRSASEEI
ncbi:MAG TPA: GntR family transcriptional regulator [Baekduia sp.]|nr:GntR family transcriptional regulator [Baekduia sp.]